MLTNDKFKKVIEGDFRTIEEVCLATWEPLYRFIYFKVQNREEAEDITQETYVKTLSYLQKHTTPPENFLAFIKTVALNILRDRWRQRQRRGISVNFEGINPKDTASVDHQKAVTQRLQIENALVALSPDQRDVLNLRIYKGHSVAETARIMGKSEGAVRTSQYRALQALSQLLDGQD